MRRHIAKIKGVSKTIPERVLHLSTAHPWTDNRIHWRQASSLAVAGYDVGLHAVEATDNHPSTVRVSTMPRKPRLQRMTVGTLDALHVALQSRARLVHLHDPELIWLIPLLRLLGREVIYDAHEDLPTQVMDKQYIPPVLRRITSSAAAGLIRVAGATSSQVIAATETIAQRFNKDKTVVVRNFPQLTRGAFSKNQHVTNRATYAVYVGGISPERGCGTVIDALNSPNMPKSWQLLVAGTGKPAYIEQLQKKPGWKNVKYYGQVPSSQARKLIAQSRVGIVTLHNTAAYRDSLPTKLFEYMAEGAAIIASDFPLWRTILEKYDCGLLVDENSPNAIAHALKTYAEDEALLLRHSTNGMRAAREVLNWENESQRLLKAYSNVLARNHTENAE